MLWSARIVLILWVVCGTFGASSDAMADEADLRGRVVDQDGSPRAGATVTVWTARPAVGPSYLCPSCWRDCGRSALTDSDGLFTIESVDPSLIYRLLVTDEGAQPRFVDDVDPTKSEAVPIELIARAIDARADGDRLILGRVVDLNGDPIARAAVNPFATHTGRGWHYGKVSCDPLAITDKNGEFAIVCEWPGQEIMAQVDAAGYAQVKVGGLRSGVRNDPIMMGAGATLRGRVMRGGEPVEGAVMALMGVEREAGYVLDAVEIATTPDGRFEIVNVPPNRDYFLYGKLGSLPGDDVVPIQRVEIGGHDSQWEAGEIEVQRGVTVAGRIVLADGAPIPEHTTVLLSRRQAWDALTATPDADGAFVFRGVPRETISLSAMIEGYEVSEENLTLDRLNGGSIVGRVSGDITDLTLLLESEPVARRDRELTNWRFRSPHWRWENRPLRGVDASGGAPDPTVLSGRIVDANGDAIEGATIHAIRAWAFGGGHHFRGTASQVVGPAMSDTDGAFSLTSDEPHTLVSIEVDASRRAKARVSDLMTGQDWHEIVLAPAAALEGRLIGLDGEPIAGAKLSVSRVEDAESLFDRLVFQTETDEAGHFRFEGLPAGVDLVLYTPLAARERGDASGALRAQQVMIPEDDEVHEVGEFHLEPGFHLAGVVRTLTGEPAAGDQMTVTALETGERVALELDQDGRFAFEDLPRGVYRINVFGHSGHPSAANASVNPDNPQSLVGVLDRDIDEMLILMERSTIRIGPRAESIEEELRQKPLAGAPSR